MVMLQDFRFLTEVATSSKTMLYIPFIFLQVYEFGEIALTIKS